MIDKQDALFSDFEVTGVDDSDRLQSQLATVCADSFSSPIRPYIQPETHGDKIVVVVHIPESPSHHKPVYLKKKGIKKGTFRRMGPTDQTCTDDDLEMFYQNRGHGSHDETTIHGSSIADIDSSAVSAYRSARHQREEDSEILAFSDDELLHALGATDEENGTTRLTVAGLLLFGHQAALRRHLPQTRIDYIRVEGREWVPDPENRYRVNERRGPLLLLIPSLISTIIEEIPMAFSMSEEGVYRKDVPIVPRTVIREAIVNAAMHRSYKLHQPMQVIRRVAADNLPDNCSL